MKAVIVPIVVAVVVALRITRYRRRRNARRLAAEGVSPSTPPVAAAGSVTSQLRILSHRLGDVGEIAMREITERTRGRIFRVGTLFILVAIALAIVIPSVHKGNNAPTRQTVAVVGTLSATARQVVIGAAAANGDHAEFIGAATVSQAKADLLSGHADLAVVNSTDVVLAVPLSAKKSTADPSFVTDVASYLGVLRTYAKEGLSSAQIGAVLVPKPIPITIVQPDRSTEVKPMSVIGLILLFVMLSQYCTWTLMGVMQEKASRVVEVLLATVRPLQLLGGKVLGIGIVALGQAGLALAFALILGRAVGSSIFKGTGPTVLVCELVWLILGYAFYCWVYAAAGSTAERQDQVQTLALPLSLPILFGYIVSITAASTGSASLLVKVLAYLPPTAPFCMSTLVGLNDVTWWQFVASALISIVSTVGVAVFAAGIYRRAVLRSGGRVHIRELLTVNRRRSVAL